jgi:hypothetical protein
MCDHILWRSILNVLYVNVLIVDEPEWYSQTMPDATHTRSFGKANEGTTQGTGLLSRSVRGPRRSPSCRGRVDRTGQARAVAQNVGENFPGIGYIGERTAEGCGQGQHEETQPQLKLAHLATSATPDLQRKPNVRPLLVPY